MSDPKPENTGFRHFIVTDETPEEREKNLTAQDLRISLVVKGVVAEEMKIFAEKYMPSQVEKEWIALAMKREARKEAWQQAVIEKTTIGLIYAAVAGLLGVMWTIASEYFRAHGWKA